MGKLLTRSGHVALVHVTKATVVPASENGYKPNKTFLLKAIGTDPISIEVRLVDHSASESITLSISPTFYSEELIKEVIGVITEDTLIAGF